MKQPKKKEIIAAYDNADEKGKELLESLYPDMEFEQKSIIERIKTFEDAYKELGDNHPLVRSYRGRNIDKNLIAYMKLRIIIAALNEGWDVREQTDGYYLRVVFRGGSSAFAFDGLAYASASSYASVACSLVSSRIVFKSKELADYCAKQFADLWKDYFIG